MKEKMEITGAILAGGASTRMGFNKAFIEIGGEAIIKRSLKVLKEVFNRVIIVATNPLLYESLDCMVATDIYRGAGSLGGLYTALFHAPGDYLFVVACDMPYLSKDCVRRIIEGRGSSDAYVPFIDGKLHPLHGLYSKRCIRKAEEMIKGGNLRITDLLEKVRTKRLEEKDFKGLDIRSSIVNINTKEDLSRIGEAL